MKFTVKHYYVAEFTVDAETAEQALDMVSLDAHQFGIIEPTQNPDIALSSFEFYDNIEPEALPD